MSFLDALLRITLRITRDGVALPARTTLDFHGATVEDDPVAQCTRVTALKGDKGDTGSQGTQGIQGVQGAKGDKGDTGSAAVSVRRVITGNVADLANWDPLSVPPDGATTVHLGDIFLLVGQTTPAQNGPYEVTYVGDVVNTLVRVSWWSVGMTMSVGAPTIKVLEGTLFGRTEWEAMRSSTSTFTVGTDDPGLLPKSWHTSVAFDIGTNQKTLSPAWMGAITAADIEAHDSGVGPLHVTRSGQDLQLWSEGASWNNKTVGVTIRNWRA